MINFLIQIISSWQVIVATAVLILYVYLVSYVARLYRRPRPVSLFPSKPKSKKSKAPPEAAFEGGEGEAPETADDELGLEER